MSSALTNQRRSSRAIKCFKIPLAFFSSLLLQIYFASRTISTIGGFDQISSTKNLKTDDLKVIEPPNFSAESESANQMLPLKFDGGNNENSLKRSKRSPTNSDFYDEDSNGHWKTVYHWKMTKTKTTTRKKGKGRRKNGTAKKPAQRQWEEEKQMPKVTLNRRRKPFQPKKRRKHRRNQRNYFSESPEGNTNNDFAYYQSMPMANDQGEIPVNSDSEGQMVQDGHHPELERVQNKSLVREIPGEDDDDNEEVIDEGNLPIQERFEVTPDVPPPLQNPPFDGHGYNPASANNMENPQNGKIWPNNDHYYPRVDNYHHSTENASRRFEPSPFRNTKNNWKKNKSSPQPSTKKRGWKKKLFDRAPDSSPDDDHHFSFWQGGVGKPPPEQENSLHREGKSSPAPRKHIQKPTMYPESNRFQDVSDRVEKDSLKFPSISHYYSPPVKHKSSRKNTKNSIYQKIEKPDKIMSPDEDKRLEGIEAPSKAWRSSDFDRTLSASSSPRKSAESDSKMGDLLPEGTDSIDGERPHQISLPSSDISMSRNDKKDSVSIPETIARVDPENAPNLITTNSTKDKQPFLSVNSSSFASQINGTVAKSGTELQKPSEGGQNSVRNNSVISVPIRLGSATKDVSDEGSTRPASSNSTTRWFREQDSLHGNPYASIPLSSDEMKQASASSSSSDDPKNASPNDQPGKGPPHFDASSLSSSLQQNIPSETLPTPNSTDSQSHISGRKEEESIVSHISILPNHLSSPALHRSVPHYSSKNHQNTDSTAVEQIPISGTLIPLIQQNHHYFDSTTRASTSSSFSDSSPPTKNPDISIIKIDSLTNNLSKKYKKHNVSQKTARKALHFPPWSGSHETMRRLFSPKKTPTPPWSGSAETLHRLFEDEQSKQHQKGSGVQSASRRKQPSPPWSGSGETFRQLFEHKTLAASPPKPFGTQNNDKKRKRGESDTLPRNTPRSSSHRPTMGNERMIKSIIRTEGTTPPKKRRKTDFNHASSPASASFSNGSITRGQKEQALSPKNKQSPSQNPAQQFGEPSQNLKDSGETLQNLLAKAAANHAVEMAASSGPSQNEKRNGRFKEIHEMFHNPMFFGFPAESDSEITNDSDANLKSNFSNKRESHSTDKFNQSSNNFKANFVKFGRHNDPTKTENKNNVDGRGSATEKVSPFGQQQQQQETTKTAQKKNLKTNKGLKKLTLNNFGRSRKTTKNRQQGVNSKNKAINLIIQGFDALSEHLSPPPPPPLISAPIMEQFQKLNVEANDDDSKRIQTKEKVNSVETKANTITVYQNPHYQSILSGVHINNKIPNEHRPNHPHYLKVHRKHQRKPNKTKDEHKEKVSNCNGSNGTEMHRPRTKPALSIFQRKKTPSKTRKKIKDASTASALEGIKNAAAVVPNDAPSESVDVVSAFETLQNAAATTNTNSLESADHLQTRVNSFSPAIEEKSGQKSTHPKKQRKRPGKVNLHQKRLLSDAKAGQVEKTLSPNDSVNHRELPNVQVLKPTSEPLSSSMVSLKKGSETNCESSKVMKKAEDVFSFKSGSSRRPTPISADALPPPPEDSMVSADSAVANVDGTYFSTNNENPGNAEKALLDDNRLLHRQKQYNNKKQGSQKIRRNRMDEKMKTTMGKGENRRPSKNFGAFIRPNKIPIRDRGSNGTERFQRQPVVVSVEKSGDVASFTENSSGSPVVVENREKEKEDSVFGDHKNIEKENHRKLHPQKQHHYPKSIFVGQKNPVQEHGRHGSEVENIDLNDFSPSIDWSERNPLLEGYSEEQWYRAAHYPGGPPLLVTVRKRNRPKNGG